MGNKHSALAKRCERRERHVGHAQHDGCPGYSMPEPVHLDRRLVKTRCWEYHLVPEYKGTFTEVLRKIALDVDGVGACLLSIVNTDGVLLVHVEIP
jgi:hypothetical protein